MVRKSLVILLVLGIVISTFSGAVYATAIVPDGTVLIDNQLTNATTGFANNGEPAGTTNMNITNLKNGANGYAKIDVTPAATVINGKFADYYMGGKGYTATNYDTITLESRIKISSPATTLVQLITFNEAGNGTDGFGYPLNLTANAGTATVGSGSFPYEHDEDVNSPDFTKGWQTIWIQVNLDTKATRVYWNNAKSYMDLPVTTGPTGQLYVFRISPQTLAGATEHNISYVDYVKMYTGAPLGLPATAADGTLLASRQFTGNTTGFDATGSITSGVYGTTKYAKVASTAAGQFPTLSLASLGINSTNYPKKVTIETRVKLSTASQITLQVHGDYAAGFPLVTSSAATNGNVNLSNTATVVPYQYDVNSATPDFSMGWQTVWIELNFETSKTKVYWANRLQSLETSTPNLGTIRWFRFGLSAPTSIVYADHVKVYTGPAIGLPDIADGTVLLNQNFDNSAALGFVKNGGTTVSSITQQVDGANKYAKITITGANSTSSNVDYMLDSLNIKSKSVGGDYDKVTVETRVKMSSAGWVRFANYTLPGFQMPTRIEANNGTASFINAAAGPFPTDSYEFDASEANPDFTKGWKTIWQEIDFKTNTSKVYWGDYMTVVNFTNTQMDSLSFFRVLAQTNATAAPNTVYVDKLKIYSGPANVSTDGKPWAESRISNNMLKIKILDNYNTPTYDGDIYVLYNDGSIAIFPLPTLNSEVDVVSSTGYQKVFVWDKDLRPYSKAIER